MAPKSKKTSRQSKSANADLIPVDSWSDADKCLGRLGELQREIAKEQVIGDKGIAAITSVTQEVVAPLQTEADLIRRSLKVFCQDNKARLGNARSWTLAAGCVGWRKSTSISIARDKTLAMIKKLCRGTKRDAMIIVKESVDKNALAHCTDDELARIGARRKTKDEFFAEPSSAPRTDYPLGTLV